MAQRLGRLRPGGVGVRVVALPRDRVDVRACARSGDAERVVDEAGDDVLVEHLARQLVAEVLAGPGVVAARRCSRCARGSTGSSRCRPRTARTVRSGNLRSTGDQTRSAAACTMFIGCSVIITSIGASIDGDDQLRRRADVQAHDGALVAAGLPERVPVVACGARAAELRRGSPRT